MSTAVQTKNIVTKGIVARFLKDPLNILACKVKWLLDKNQIAKIGKYLSYVLSGVLIIATSLSIVCGMAIHEILTLSISAISSLALSIFLRSKDMKKVLKKRELTFFQDPNSQTVLKKEILSIYLRHEKTFDKDQVHGRIHICRCIIFTQAIINFYKKQFRVEIDELKALYTVAMHDSGRKGNGKDLWEKDSENLLYNFLIKKGYSTSDALKFSKIINKSNTSKSVEEIAIRSADCLDIMRPCTNRGGKKGFNQDLLTFLHPKKDPRVATLTQKDRSKMKNIRKKMIDQAFEFIKITEDEKFKLKDSNYFEDVLDLFESNRDKFPTLFNLLKN